MGRIFRGRVDIATYSIFYMRKIENMGGRHCYHVGLCYAMT